jgi:predicted anti-sigma-YlaC factor YlaD
MLTCKDASHLMSESQERPLNLRERWGLRLHLWMCVSCRRFDQQLALLRQAIRSLRRRAEAEAQDAKLTPEAQDRIRRALAEGRGHLHD